MEQKPEIVALIPLRGGSKSIPYKNIKPIAGKPLCLWVLEAAASSKAIDKVYISTDSKKIKDEVYKSGLDVTILDRDASLATDTASTESVMLDFTGKIDFDILVTIQATSPLTSAYDLDKAIEKFLTEGLDSLVTGTRTKRFFWTDDGKPVNYEPKKRPRRQDFSGYIMENGAFYLTNKKTLINEKCRIGGKTGIYEMCQETAIEIDEPGDWEVVERLLLNKKHQSLHNIFGIVKMLVMDVDGVLTDSSVFYDEKGNEMKRFSVRDGMGLGLIHRYGIKTAIITKEATDIIDHRAKKLKIDHVFKGIDDKVKILKILSEKANISLEEVAYIGDDINDAEALQLAGVSIVPNDCEESLKKVADYICEFNGGKGCVREVCNLILEHNVSKNKPKD